MHNLGARKMVVVNVGPIGCIPYQREVNLADPDSCVEFPNQLARSFNAKLRTLVTKLNTNLPGAKFVYADVYSMVEDIIENYTSYGETLHCCDFPVSICLKFNNETDWLCVNRFREYKLCMLQSCWALWGSNSMRSSAIESLCRPVQVCVLGPLPSV